MPTLDNYLTIPAAANIGVWVQIVSNTTGLAYVSTAPTDGTGRFRITAPADTYTVFIGATNVGPWIPNGDQGFAFGTVVSVTAADASITVGGTLTAPTLKAAPQGNTAGIATTPGLPFQPGAPLFTKVWDPTKNPAVYEDDLLFVLEPAYNEMLGIKDYEYLALPSGTNTYWTVGQAKAGIIAGPFARPAIGEAGTTGDMWVSSANGILPLDQFTVLFWLYSDGADYTAQPASAHNFEFVHIGGDSITGQPGLEINCPTVHPSWISATLSYPTFNGSGGFSGVTCNMDNLVAGDIPANTWTPVWVTWDGASLVINTKQGSGGAGKTKTHAGALPAPIPNYSVSDQRSKPKLFVSGPITLGGAGTYPYRVGEVAVYRYKRTLNQAYHGTVKGRTLSIDAGVTQGAWPSRISGTCGLASQGVLASATPVMQLQAALGDPVVRYTTGHEGDSHTAIIITNPGPAQTYNFPVSTRAMMSPALAAGLSTMYFQFNYMPTSIRAGSATAGPINQAPGASTQRGPWAVGTTYAINDTVTFNGATTHRRAYYSLANGNVGNSPPDGGNNAFWHELCPEWTLYAVDQLDDMVNGLGITCAGLGFWNEPLGGTNWTAPNGNADLTNFWLATAVRIADDPRLAGKVAGGLGTCDGVWNLDRTIGDSPALTAEMAAAALNAVNLPAVNIHSYTDLGTLRSFVDDVLVAATAAGIAPKVRVTEWNVDQTWLVRWGQGTGNTDASGIFDPQMTDMWVSCYAFAQVADLLMQGSVDIMMWFSGAHGSNFDEYPGLIFADASIDPAFRATPLLPVFEMMWKHSGTRVSCSNNGWPALKGMSSTTGGAKPKIVTTFGMFKPQKGNTTEVPISLEWADLPATFTWTQFRHDTNTRTDGRLMKVASGDQTNLPAAIMAKCLSVHQFEIQGA